MLSYQKAICWNIRKLQDSWYNVWNNSWCKLEKRI